MVFQIYYFTYVDREMDASQHKFHERRKNFVLFARVVLAQIYSWRNDRLN